MFFSNNLSSTEQSDISSHSKSKQAALQRVTHPAYIIQRVRMQPHSFSSADAMVLQRTIGNQAVCQLMKEVGLINDNTESIQRQALPEEDEVLKGESDEIQGGVSLEEEEEEPVQMKNENKTGLSMNNVSMNYNITRKVIQRVKVSKRAPGASERLARNKFKYKAKKRIDPHTGRKLSFQHWKQGYEAQHIIPYEICLEYGLNDGEINGAWNGTMLPSGRSKASAPYWKAGTRYKNRPFHINPNEGIAHPIYNKWVRKQVKEAMNANKTNKPVIEVLKQVAAEIRRMGKAQNRPMYVSGFNAYTIQRTIGDQAVCQLLSEKASTNQVSTTGLPDKLKAGVENLAGLSMDEVRVHYNSSKPAQVGALAYTQGTDIHVAPGQEKHLPHEAWHVVQQAQGRVRPTMQMKGVAVNDDAGLEHEADKMGDTAATQTKVVQRGCISSKNGSASAPVVQAVGTTITIRDGDTPNWRFIPANNPTVLQTSPMGYCWALIIINPDHSRILAHLPGGDAEQLNSGGLDSIKKHIKPGAEVTIVRGLANDPINTSAFTTSLLYKKLKRFINEVGDGKTRIGVFRYASVDANGNIKTWS